MSYMDLATLKESFPALAKVLEERYPSSVYAHKALKALGHGTPLDDVLAATVVALIDGLAESQRAHTEHMLTCMSPYVVPAVAPTVG